MNKPISISIVETRDRIVAALNESGLPASVLEMMLNALYQQVVQAAQAELEAAKKQLAEQEEKDNA